MATATQTIRDIVAHQPSAAAVLQRFEIDLCSQAGTSLDSACANLQLSIDQVLEKLSDAESTSRPGALIDPESVSLSRLMQHIVRIHHQYVRQELPTIAQMARKVAATHGVSEPVFHKVANLVEDLRIDLVAHFEKEEQILFPYIAQMDQQAVLAYLPPHCYPSMSQPVFIMAQEHESAEHILDEIEKITHGFDPGPDACATRIALMASLRAFQANLRQHVSLEDDVLFPRAIAMEAALTPRS